MPRLRGRIICESGGNGGGGSSGSGKTGAEEVPVFFCGWRGA